MERKYDPNEIHFQKEETRGKRREARVSEQPTPVVRLVRCMLALAHPLHYARTSHLDISHIMAVLISVPIQSSFWGRRSESDTCTAACLRESLGPLVRLSAPSLR